MAVRLNPNAIACTEVAQTLAFLACLSHILELTSSFVKGTSQLQDLRQESGKEPRTGMATKLGYRWHGGANTSWILPFSLRLRGLFWSYGM